MVFASSDAICGCWLHSGWGALLSKSGLGRGDVSRERIKSAIEALPLARRLRVRTSISRPFGFWRLQIAFLVYQVSDLVHGVGIERSLADLVHRVGVRRGCVSLDLLHLSAGLFDLRADLLEPRAPELCVRLIVLRLSDHHL